MSKRQIEQEYRTYDRVFSGHAVTVQLRGSLPVRYVVYAPGRRRNIVVANFDDRGEAWRLCTRLRAAFVRGRAHPFAPVALCKPKLRGRNKP